MMTMTKDVGKTAVLLAALVAAVACAPAAEQDDGRAALESSIVAFYDAVEAGDKNGHAEMFSDGALMMPNNGAIRRGKENIGEMIRSGEGWVFRIRNLERVELDLSGDIAYTVNQYEYTWHQEGDDPTWHPTKNIHIWRRQADGGWKLHVDIWNSSE